MISVSSALRAALTADARRVRVKATVRIVDPDISFDRITTPDAAPWSDTAQLSDETENPTPPLITLEKNKWLLDGGYIAVENRGEAAQTGYVSTALCSADGVFDAPQVITIEISGVTRLIALSVFFSDRPEDGVPTDFTLEILNSGGVAASKTFSGNTDYLASLENIMIAYPTALRITVTKMSVAYRRLRIIETVFGLYEHWTGDDLEECEISQQGDFSGLAIPFGTARLTMDNHDRRYEPRNKDGIFAAIEERQDIKLWLGADTVSGTEYVPAGVYYQHENGWKTSSNAATMTWDLVDIIGLLQDRQFAPTTLPTTLGGWAQELVTQLGNNFSDRFSVDLNYADLPCTVTGIEALSGVTCGQILIWVCQATGTFARADAETGKLTIEPYWNQGVTLDLDNIESYPEMSANDDISLITFTLSDGTEVSYNGNSLAASKTASVNNPFLHTVAQARAVAEQIITAHGGNQIATTGRGDFTSEIGDVATVQLDKSNATTARVMYQSFGFQGGVLRGCQTKLLQATGGKLYDETVLITESGTWKCPEGVTAARLTLGQGGQGGGKGYRGTISLSGSNVVAENGERGVAGSGGKIWHMTVPLAENQTYTVEIGAGGAAGTIAGEAGAEGGHTTFAAYTSANGEVYPNGYTDILNGDSYGRSGVELPLNGTGDGGQGGEGGRAGRGYADPIEGPDGKIRDYDLVITRQPTDGKSGVSGGGGFCLIQFVRAAE